MYEQYFGLTAKPFQLTPDPDFFFSSRGHSRARSFLEYGLFQREGFIVITGEVGTGKTTLIRGLLRTIEQQHIVAAQIVSTQVDADDLLRLVVQAFGLEFAGADKASILATLESFFRALHLERRRALLVIDEAQNLSARAVEELRMLSNFQIGTDALVQSFLVGQPEFRLIMQRPEMQQLKQRVIASYHLGPLDRAETRQYIEHRLSHAGWHGQPSIEEAVFEQVFRFTGGVPRRINTLCDRLLLDCYLADRREVTEESAQGVIADFSEEFGAQQANNAYTLNSSNTRNESHGVRTAAGGDPHSAVVTLDGRDPDCPPTRYDLLDTRIRKLEATQEMLQRLIGRMVRVLPAQIPDRKTGSDDE